MNNSELINLLNRYQNGDEKSFSLFYDSLKKKIFYNIVSYVKNYDIAEDLLQETFVNFLKSINKFDKNKSILSYLMVLSKNLSLDYLKKNKVIILEESDLDTSQDRSKNNEVKNVFNNNELLEYLKHILNNDEYKVLIRHLVNEETFKDISLESKVPLGTIEWQYNSAIRKIRKKEGELNLWIKLNIRSKTKLTHTK